MLFNQFSQRNLLRLPAELRQQIFYEALRPEKEVDFSNMTGRNNRDRGFYLLDRVYQVMSQSLKHSIGLQRLSTRICAVDLQLKYLSP